MQIRDEVEKMKPLVGHMVQHKEKVTEEPAVKRIQIQLKKAPKSPMLTQTQRTQTMTKKNLSRKSNPQGQQKEKQQSLQSLLK